jgi:hypothetical protein
MPLFTYRCPMCKREWDERRDREDELLDVSEETCSCVIAPVFGERVRFQSAPSVVFMGTGWACKDRS